VQHSIVNKSHCAAMQLYKPASLTSSQIWVLQWQEDCFLYLLLYIPAGDESSVLARCSGDESHCPAMISSCKPSCCFACMQQAAPHSKPMRCCWLQELLRHSCKHSLQSYNIIQRA
jgi:hypothetical protein